MSTTIDAATGYYPVFGEDIVITGYEAKLEVIGHTFKPAADEVTARNAVGDTKIRVLYDIGQNDELSLDVFVKGADASAANANNEPIAVGTTIAITSTKHPKTVGNWLVKPGEQTGSNTAISTWSINLVRKLS